MIFNEGKNFYSFEFEEEDTDLEKQVMIRAWQQMIATAKLNRAILDDIRKLQGGQ